MPSPTGGSGSDSAASFALPKSTVTLVLSDTGVAMLVDETGGVAMYPLPSALCLGSSKRSVALPQSRELDKVCHTDMCRARMPPITAGTLGTATTPGTVSFGRKSARAKATRMRRPLGSGGRLSAAGSGGGLSAAFKAAGACDASTVRVSTPFFSSGRPLYFFGVAVNYISQPQNTLTSCWNDVASLQAAFAARYGKFAKSWLLTDNPSPTLNRAATAVQQLGAPTSTGLESAWSNLLTTIGRTGGGGEVDIVFAYSGHGSYRPTTDPTSLTGQSDCIVLLDKFFWDTEIHRLLISGVQQAGVRMLMVLDSCNSANAARLGWTWNQLSDTANQASTNTDVSATSPTVALISGCRDEQTSAAGPTTADLSECTRVLLQSLGAGAAGAVPITNVVREMRSLLRAAHDTQIPQLSLSQPELVGALL